MQDKVMADPVMLRQNELIWLQKLIKAGEQHDFYVWCKWLKEREFVLKQDKYECQRCKENGRYRRAVLVHHINHLKQRPDIALKMWITGDDGKLQRQLVSLCRECHEHFHPERMHKQYELRESFKNPERWD